MVGGWGSTVFLGVLIGILLAGAADGKLYCTWCHEDFDGGGGGGETYNATLIPNDGKYLNRTDDSVYVYDSTAGSLTLLEENSQETQDGPNQAGECECVLGDWTNPDAEYTYGRCINLRVKNNSEREIQSRLNVREIDTGPYKIVVDLHFLDSDGNSTGEPERLYADLCFSGEGVGSHKLIRCEAMRSPELDDSGWPSDAAQWCVRGGLLEYEGGDYEPRLEVKPPCREV